MEEGEWVSLSHPASKLLVCLENLRRKHEECTMKALLLNEEVVAVTPPDAGSSDPIGIKPKLKIITNWKMYRVTHKLALSEGIPFTKAQAMVAEYKRWLKLKVMNPKAELAMSSAVDPAWHMHLLFTRDYLRMCMDVFGEFLHHEPTVSHEENLKLADKYATTLRLYEQVYGEPDVYWWAPAAMVCTNNGNPSNCAH